jgi:hypothetical protein
MTLTEGTELTPALGVGAFADTRLVDEASARRPLVGGRRSDRPC